MDKKQKIEQEIRKTLEQFEHTEELPSNPWFHTRVMSCLDNQQEKRGIYTEILRPILLTALIALNIGTAAWYFSSSASYAQSSTRQQLIEILSGDLNANSNQSLLFYNK
jgi:hypothetical protein